MPMRVFTTSSYLLSFPPSRRAPPFLYSLLRYLSLLPPPPTRPPDAAEISTIYQTVNASSSPDSVGEDLKQSGILLTNSLIDGVLRRVRFAHGDPIRALALYNHAAARKGFYHTPFALETMLYLLGRNRRFEHCWEVLREARRKDPDLITPRALHVLLGRVAKVCSVRHTVESFWKSKRFFGDRFDTSCFNALLRALCQEKSMVDARNVYHDHKRKFKPNLQTFNILLSGWKSPQEVWDFFEEMREMGVVAPDVVSYNCLVDVLCKNFEMDKAFKVVDTMRDEEIYPDQFTYTSIIGGLGLVGQPDKAKEILREMKEYGCYPDAASYNATIRNYCIAKRLDVAFDLMNEMESQGVPPNATTYNTIFRSFYWSNDLLRSWDIYRRMKMVGCLPNTQSCMFLIRLCRRQENAEMAMELWDDMVEKGFGSFTLVSDVLLDLLCDMGKLAEAERCCLQMIDRGQKPSSVSFKRVKVLMTLADKHESLRNLSEKMATFGHLAQLDIGNCGTDRDIDGLVIPDGQC